MRRLQIAPSVDRASFLAEPHLVSSMAIFGVSSLLRRRIRIMAESQPMITKEREGRSSCIISDEPFAIVNPAAQNGNGASAAAFSKYASSVDVSPFLQARYSNDERTRPCSRPCVASAVLRHRPRRRRRRSHSRSRSRVLSKPRGPSVRFSEWFRAEMATITRARWV